MINSLGRGLAVLFLFLVAATLSEGTVNQTSSTLIDYCPDYCDADDFFQPGFWCQKAYCCGDLNQRRCCEDPEKAVDYQGVKSCPTSQWWFYQRLIVGLLTSLIIILVLAACCYYCCSGDSYREASGRRRRLETEMTNVGANNTSGPQPIPFNPQSQYAFQPPDYDSLPKDPPNYMELFGTASHPVVQVDVPVPVPQEIAVSGAENQAFEGDELPPPSYVYSAPEGECVRSPEPQEDGSETSSPVMNTSTSTAASPPAPALPGELPSHISPENGDSQPADRINQLSSTHVSHVGETIQPAQSAGSDNTAGDHMDTTSDHSETTTSSTGQQATNTSSSSEV